jgi:hypothetical protein
MKNIALLFGIPLCLAPVAALAQGMNAPPPAEAQPLCVRADHSTDYNARAIGRHDIYIQNALGKDRRALRLTTTCIDLDPISIKGVAVHSFSECVAQGDPVSAASTDGRVEHCRVSRVSPFIPGTEEKGYK